MFILHVTTTTTNTTPYITSRFDFNSKMSWSKPITTNSLDLAKFEKITPFQFNTPPCKPSTFNLDGPNYFYPDFRGNNKLHCAFTSIPTWLMWTLISWMLHHESTPSGNSLFEAWFGSVFIRLVPCYICNCTWQIKDTMVCLECWLRNIFEPIRQHQKTILEDNFWFTRVAKLKQDKMDIATTWEEVHLIYNNNSIHPHFTSSLKKSSPETDPELYKYTKFDFRFIMPYLLSSYCISSKTNKQVRKFENPYTFALRIILATGNTSESVVPFLFKELVFCENVLKNSCNNYLEGNQISGILATQCIIPTITLENYASIIREYSLNLTTMTSSIDYLICNNCFKQVVEEVNDVFLNKNKNNVLFIRCWDASFYHFIINLRTIPKVDSVVLCVSSFFLKQLENLDSLKEIEWFLMPECCTEALEMLQIPPQNMEQIYNKAKQIHYKHNCSRTIKLSKIKQVLETFNIRLFNVQNANQRLHGRLRGMALNLENITKMSPFLDVCIPTLVNCNFNKEEMYMFVFNQGVSVERFYNCVTDVFNYSKYFDYIGHVTENLLERTRLSENFKQTNSARIIKSMEHCIKYPVVCVGPVDVVKVACKTKDGNFIKKLLLCTAISSIKKTMYDNGNYCYTLDYLNNLENIASQFSVYGSVDANHKTVPLLPREKPINNTIQTHEEQFFGTLKNSFAQFRHSIKTNVLCVCGIPQGKQNTCNYETSFGLNPITGIFDPFEFVEEVSGSLDEHKIRKFVSKNVEKVSSVNGEAILNLENIVTNPIMLPNYCSNSSIQKQVTKFKNLQIWPKSVTPLYQLLNISKE